MSERASPLLRSSPPSLALPPPGPRLPVPGCPAPPGPAPWPWPPGLMIYMFWTNQGKSKPKKGMTGHITLQTILLGKVDGPIISGQH